MNEHRLAAAFGEYYRHLGLDVARRVTLKVGRADVLIRDDRRGLRWLVEVKGRATLPALLFAIGGLSLKHRWLPGCALVVAVPFNEGAGLYTSQTVNDALAALGITLLFLDASGAVVIRRGKDNGLP